MEFEIEIKKNRVDKNGKRLTAKIQKQGQKYILLENSYIEKAPAESFLNHNYYNTRKKYEEQGFFVDSEFEGVLKVKTDIKFQSPSALIAVVQNRSANSQDLEKLPEYFKKELKMNNYTWLPFFEELLDKICKTSNSTALYKSFKSFSSGKWDDIDKIDPLSYIGCINGGSKVFYERCKIAKETFNLESEIPKDNNAIPAFPRGNFIYIYEFYKNKPLDEVVNALWEFANNVNDSNIDGNLFNKIVQFDNIGVGKLSQFMYICKPTEYYSCDSTMLLFLNYTLISKDYNSFQEVQRLGKETGLSPYELSMQAWNQKENKKIEINKENITKFSLIGAAKDEEKLDYKWIIKDKGAWASWWSYPIKPEYEEQLRSQLPIKLYIYQNGTIKLFYEIEDFITQSGNEGIECPQNWEKYLGSGTLANTKRAPHNDTNSGIFKTWFLVKKIEQIEDPLTLNNFAPLIGDLSASTLRNGFGYVKEYTLNKKNYHLNQILYGPPGTGKTYNTIIKALEIIEGIEDKQYTEAEYQKLKEKFDNYKNIGRVKFITFHQSYAYEEFVEGIKPDLKGDELKYKLEDGIFKQICTDANKNPDKDYVLIIDEINRGNISKILGELITLIENDKRIQANGEDELKITSESLKNSHALTVKLPYSQEDFGVPNNLYIIGTMNTSDRSIASVDIALRRRFKFIEKMPKPELIKDLEKVALKQIFGNMNNKISILLDREHKIGHSYFMNIDDTDKLKDVWFECIIPLLNEYFYGEWDKLKEILGLSTKKDSENEKEHDGFIKKSNIPKFVNSDFNSEEFYDFVKKNEINFVEAMNKLEKNNETEQ